MQSRLHIDFAPLAAAPRGAIAVGLSGGLDSSALLHALAAALDARSRGLRAIHVHHGLHADADRWQMHCEAICSRLEIPLTSLRVRVRPDGDGPESAARRARMAAFEQALGDGDILALGHHRDDQAETFLLRALRASGPDGLRAMRGWRAFGRGWLWRPLLATPRADLIRYATAQGIAWIDDPSNADTRFDRNFIRARVMPLLRERWPHADDALARSAGLCEQATDLLDDEDAAVLEATSTGDGDLDIASLRAVPAPRRARVLRRWVESRQLPPLPADGIRRIEAELLEARDDARARYDWHGATVRAWRGRLHAGRAQSPVEPPPDLHWNGSAPLHLLDGGVLALSSPTALPVGLRVRNRIGGERIRLQGRGHSHSLKHVLQASDVPPWLREHLPLLVDGDEVLAAGDRVVGARLAAVLRHAGCTLVWSPPPGV